MRTGRRGAFAASPAARVRADSSCCAASSTRGSNARHAVVGSSLPPRRTSRRRPSLVSSRSSRRPMVVASMRSCAAAPLRVPVSTTVSSVCQPSQFSMSVPRSYLQKCSLISASLHWERGAAHLLAEVDPTARELRHEHPHAPDPFADAQRRDPAARLSDASLVIIDAQADYQSGRLPLSGIDSALANIAALLKRARDAGTPISTSRRSAGRDLFDGDGGAILPQASPTPANPSSSSGCPTPSPAPNSTAGCRRPAAAT